jgi:aspartokinase-like uncharacterized kinase
VSISWVVKLGGSLYRSEQLTLWLEALAESGVVVVPGGGPFADQVRMAQEHWRFGDKTAHVMAILAMAQYGLMLTGLSPRLRTASDFRELSAMAEMGESIVWVPELSRLAEMDVRASWSVTSDSLSAWLAGRLGARRLLLVKSAEVPGGRIEPAQLAANGLVDQAFPGMIGGASYETWWCGPLAHFRLKEGFQHPETTFTRIVPGR